MRHSPYREWLKFVEEWPELRWDLEQKLDFFICWRLDQEDLPNWTESMPTDPATLDAPYEYEGPWIECWQCHGEGFLDDCFEDTCVCLDPPCMTTHCDICGGKGGWHEKDESDAG